MRTSGGKAAARFIPSLLGLAVADRQKTREMRLEWKQAKHLAALHEIAEAARAKQQALQVGVEKITVNNGTGKEW